MSEEKIFTDGNFQQEVLANPKPVVVDFWAEWCGPCRMLGPVVERIAQENADKVVVGKLNVDENLQIPQQYGIQGIPALLFFKGGKLVQQAVGFQSQENIQQIIDEIAG